MNVLVSGVAARAVFIDGPRVSYIDADWPDAVRPASPECVSILLADAPDVLELKNASRDEALERLLELWNKDRALRMIQVVQQAHEEPEDVALAVEYLDSLIKNPAVYSGVLNHALAIPSIRTVDPAELLPLARWKRGRDIIVLINDMQPSIKDVRNAWQALESSLFGNCVDRAKFEKSAIESGIFRKLVERHNKKSNLNDAILEAYVALNSFKNSRAIVREWARNIGVPESENPVERIEIEMEGPDAPWADDAYDDATSAKQRYDWVRKSQDGIIERLRKNDILHAKKFTRDLINNQLDAGDNEFAAMSLCFLAKEAKQLGFLELALEWTVEATQISPEDGRAHGQAADVYFALHRFTEAQRSYQLAALNGKRRFGLYGQARILKETHQLPQALEAFQTIKAAFPSEEESYRTDAAIGEVLRDMGRLDEAVRAYEQAANIPPQQAVLWCGRASVLKDMGRLEEALEVYRAAIARFPKDVYAYAGAADVLKLLGHYDDALAAYDEVINLFPDEEIGPSGHAGVLKEKGDIRGALKEYMRSVQRFRNSSSLHAGYAEALREAGHLDEAEETYKEAVAHFRFEPRLRNGYANLLRTRGRFAEALSAYDAAMHDFPFDFSTRVGRAHLLKEMGLYDLSAKAFDDIINLRPEFQSAKYHKAALLVIAGEFEKAEALLPSTPPGTRDEWVAEHVRGMIFLRTGRFEQATAVFKRGVENNPFAKERRFFQNALAVAALAGSQYRDAMEYAKSGEGVVANVLSFHSMAGMGRNREASEKMNELLSDGHSNVVALTIEIGARYGITSASPQHETSWLESKEVEVALALIAA